MTRGVTISPASRYACVSNETLGSTRGTVDVLELEGRRPGVSIPVRYEPGRIVFWKMEPIR